MSLRLLFFDELKGFAKSKVMVILWIGLPLLSFLIHFLQPDAEGIPVSFLVGILVSSIGGTLSSIMLSTSIVSEKNRHVYELFLIRPVKRGSILLAKYLAVYLCLVIAVVLSLIVGMGIDALTVGLNESFLSSTFDSLIISISSMAITCSIGMFFGVIVSSVPVAAILSVYLGSQLSSIILLASFFIAFLNPVALAITLGVTITTIIMGINLFLFSRQQF